MPTRTLHPLLLDPRYWKERLGIARSAPRQLLVFPRQDLSWPGGEVSELWLKAHDGRRLQGLLARSLFPAPRPRLRAELKVHSEGIGAGPPPTPAHEGFDPSRLAAFLRRAGGKQDPNPSGGLELGLQFDWDRIRDGEAHLVLVQERGRRLEDRVLDLVRAVEAARQLAELATGRIELETAGMRGDELEIARQLFEQGWA